MRKNILLTAGILVSTICTMRVNAQDPELSQFYAAPVYTNPALAGSAVCNFGAAADIQSPKQREFRADFL